MTPKTPAGRLAMAMEMIEMGYVSPDDAFLIINYGKVFISVDEFMIIELTPYIIENYPNAKKAHELKQTKLYKALK